MKKNIFFLFFSFFALFCVQNSVSQEDEITIEDIKLQLKNKDLSQENRIDNLLILGRYHIGRSTDSANFYLTNALNLSKVKNDSFNIIRAYNRFSEQEKYLEDDYKTIQYADSALQYANTKNQKHFAGISYSYRNKGLAYNYLERYDLSLESLLKANSFLLKEEQDEEIKTYLAENYTDLAAIYSSIENNETAIECIKKTLSIAKPINAYWEIGDAYEFMVGHHFEAKEYLISEKYIDSAKTVYTAAENIEGIHALDKYRAEVYLKQKKTDPAIAIYKNELLRDKEDSIAYVLTDDYTFLSRAYTQKGELVLASKFLDSARIQAAISENPSHLFTIASQQAKIHKEKKQIGLGISALKSILDRDDLQSLKESQKDLYKELSELQELNNDSKNALLSLKRHDNIKDSLRSVLQKNKFNVIQSEFNYNELSSKLEARNAQLLVSKAEEKRAKDRTYFTIGLLGLFGLFFAFSFYRQKKLNTIKRESLIAKQEVLAVKQEALDNQVKFKNKQITDFAIHISEKNELLENIKKKLKGVKVINDAHKSIVQDTIHFINSDIDQNKEKIQLYQQVNETNDSFRAKLDQMYTNLNEKEKKVATMLRLGQTSKQIALQLGISAASVDNYRYNLRKKMEIPKGESLKNFIKNI